jgi:hypothetical protein
MKQELKIFFSRLYLCKGEILKCWLFFFVLSMVGDTPHSTLGLFLISGLFSVFVVSLALLCIRIKG